MPHFKDQNAETKHVGLALCVDLAEETAHCLFRGTIQSGPSPRRAVVKNAAVAAQKTATPYNRLTRVNEAAAARRAPGAARTATVAPASPASAPTPIFPRLLAREAKVAQFNMSIGVEKDVGRLYVTVHDALRVQVSV